jgi:hypothetical protein
MVHFILVTATAAGEEQERADDECGAEQPWPDGIDIAAFG